MLEAIKTLFNVQANDDSYLVTNVKDKPELAAAALMVEVMAADHNQQPAEIAALKHLLEKQFQLSDTQAEQLVDEAIAVHDAATDYFAFTRQINTQYSMAEKIQLLEQLWLMAAADDVIEAVEQHVIRRIASLLHISHSDFIAAKLRVMESG